MIVVECICEYLNQKIKTMYSNYKKVDMPRKKMQRLLEDDMKRINEIDKERKKAQKDVYKFSEIFKKFYKF